MYKTTNIIQASVLLLDGHELKEVKPASSYGRMCEFIFDDVKDEWLNDFDRQMMTVEPIAFSMKQKMLATMAARAVAGR